MKSTLRGSLVIRLVRMPAGYSRPCCSGEGGVGRTCPGLAIGGNVSFCWLAAAGRARCCYAQLSPVRAGCSSGIDLGRMGSRRFGFRVIGVTWRCALRSRA
jgi:hypothetical protein